MKSMPVRLMLVVLFLAAAVATGYLLWTSERQLRAGAVTADAIEADASAAARGAFELRAAQQAYVAAGQGERFWMDKVASTLSDLKASLDQLRAHATAPRAQTAIESASAVLAEFEEMDRRAREYARGDQRLIASDLIFSDGLEMTGAIVVAVAEARAAEREARDRVARDARRLELAALGGFAGLGLLIVLLLVPASRLPEAEPAAASAVPVPEPVAASDSLDLSLVLNKITDPELEKPAPDPVNIEGVATVCTELARVTDTRALPPILARTAEALDASGLVLWIADPDGRELTPILAHGYSPQLLIRLGTIVRDAQNATAAAFRTGLVQTVKADGVSNGAIAAPLVTPNGAVGVMAAEVRNEGERHPAKVAAATIVAAQLATLVGPPVSRGHQKADAAGA
jgi:hypothetical protein